MIAGSRRFGHEYLEGKLRQWTGWHNQEVLVLDQILHLSEQRPVKLVRAGEIQGNGSPRITSTLE